MLKNYVNIALRNFRRQKFYTLINVLGLSVGLASSLLIAWYVLDERRYDQFHQDAERTYRVTTYWNDGYRLATTPPPLYKVIQQEIPEVEAVARAFNWNHSTMRLPEEADSSRQVVFRETNIYIVDPEFLQVLDFNLIAGDAETALQHPASLVLTRATAVRYFGEEALSRGEVVGKEILFGGSQYSRRVTAVVDPGPTHFPFDMLVDGQGYGEIMESSGWGWNLMHTYLKVRPEVQAAPDKMRALRQKIARIAEQYAQPSSESEGATPVEDGELQYRLQPVTDIHLHSDLQREHEANGSATTVYTLAIVAILIVMLACINFMNLSTALATRRAKEVGVRKVLGSSRRHLVFQFLAESASMSLVAMLLALGMVEMLRSPFNHLTGKQLSFDWFQHPTLFLLIGGGVIVVGLLSGSYPAWYLSAFRPASVLKGTVASPRGARRLRSGLIVFQFVVSIGLIIVTALVIQQLRYIQSRDVGYEREQVLVIKNDREIEERWAEFKKALRQQSAIRQVSFATGVPSQQAGRAEAIRDFRQEGSALSQGMRWLLIDPDYISTLKLTLVAGRGFQEGRASDQTSGALLNEAAARELALKDPIGALLIKNQGEPDEQRIRVLGVVKDFTVGSFDQPVPPMVFQSYAPSFLSDYVVVRLASGNTARAVGQVQQVWAQFEPDNPFVYSFLDDDFDHLFSAEQRLARLLGAFTGLAIFIACLGLLGVVAFVTTQRTQEIGIRKVLGASVGQIVGLLSQDFLRLVGLGFVLAAPMAYWIVTRWLENFAYRTEISWEVFGLAGGAAFLVAGATVSIQSVRAALANPVASLRDE